MKRYYTLLQSFHHENDRGLDEYLATNDIDFKIGADFASELKLFGYTPPPGHEKDLLKKYIVLIEEHELSAIQLSVGGVTIIKNRPEVEFKNKVRGYFSWILK
jgi:hypothetical protein